MQYCVSGANISFNISTANARPHNADDVNFIESMYIEMFLTLKLHFIILIN